MEKISKEKQGNAVLNFFQNLGLGLTGWTQRWIPDAWIVALILTIIVFLLTLAWGKVGLFGAVVAFMVRGMTDHFLGGLGTAPRFNAVLWTMFAMVASVDRLRKERGTTAPAASPDNPPAVAPA